MNQEFFAFGKTESFDNILFVMAQTITTVGLVQTVSFLVWEGSKDTNTCKNILLINYFNLYITDSDKENLSRIYISTSKRTMFIWFVSKKYSCLIFSLRFSIFSNKLFIILHYDSWACSQIYSIPVYVSFVNTVCKDHVESKCIRDRGHEILRDLTTCVREISISPKGPRGGLFTYNTKPSAILTHDILLFGINP